MAFVLIKNNLKNPNLWGVSTKNPIAEVQNVFPPEGYRNFYNVKYVSRVDVIEHLPFRIRFSGIGLEGYDRANPASVGIAIIGYSNYIL
jgi:hypothetical protein